MRASLMTIVTLCAALGSGLVAGVFFAFSTFVMPALFRLKPDQGIAAMQAINVAVINPWFMGALMGTAGACLLSAALSLFGWGGPGAPFCLGGVVLYWVGTILVTGAYHVPRNDALAALDAASADAAAIWARYVQDWVRWNHLRTAAAFGAALLLTVAVLVNQRAAGSGARQSAAAERQTTHNP